MFGWKFESSQPHQSHFVPLIFHWFSPELPNRSLVVWQFCSRLGPFDLDCWCSDLAAHRFHSKLPPI